MFAGVFPRALPVAEIWLVIQPERDRDGDRWAGVVAGDVRREHGPRVSRNLHDQTVVVGAGIRRAYLNVIRGQIEQRWSSRRGRRGLIVQHHVSNGSAVAGVIHGAPARGIPRSRSEEHTSEL